jgi:hypothetical protein
MDSTSWGKFVQTTFSFFFVLICRSIADVFADLRDIFVTVRNTEQLDTYGASAFHHCRVHACRVTCP